MSNRPQIFNAARSAKSRARSAARFADHDFLHRRAMADIADRLAAVRRDFDRTLIIGAGGVEACVATDLKLRHVVYADPAADRLYGLRPGIVFDPERSPLAAASFDLVINLLTLHRANDPVGALIQHRLSLRPGGLFIGAMFGEDTLTAMRRALLAAETALAGGASPRIAPFAGVKDLGAALQRAGFELPVTDVDRVEVSYRDMLSLIRDLRGIGETGALAMRARPMTRQIFAAAIAEFAAGGSVERFDVIYLTGWRPQ